MDKTTTTFTIHPRLVMFLDSRGIRRSGWEIDKDGSTMQGQAFATLRDAKAAVERIAGYKPVWRTTSTGRYTATVEAHDA
jgi:hypothetical protein